MNPDSDGKVSAEIELLVTKAVASAKDEFRAATDSIRAESKSHATKLAGILAVFGSILAILAFFGFNQTVSKGIDKRIEELGFTALKRRAETAAGQAELSAAGASSSQTQTKNIAGEVSELLTRLKTQQAASTGFTAVNSDEQKLLLGKENIDIALPEAVPKEANEILVFCAVQSGYATHGTGAVEVTGTDANGRVTSMELYFYGYEQAAVAFNSDYFWMPTPVNRTISAKFKNYKPNANTSALVRIIGFR